MKMEAFEVVASDSLAKGWYSTIEKVVKEELAAEMGCLYRNVVLFCLKGVGGTDEEWMAGKRRSPYNNQGEDEDHIEDVGYEEVGLEKAFYWNVVKPFDRVVV